MASALKLKVHNIISCLQAQGPQTRTQLWTNLSKEEGVFRSKTDFHNHLKELQVKRRIVARHPDNFKMNQGMPFVYHLYDRPDNFKPWNIRPSAPANEPERWYVPDIALPPQLLAKRREEQN
ncbi:hypothetical protein PROFUN_07910 [Planoprotostelium fungivorum]|uniref:Uncharacterized protein n=1 Tax=Planoprotostelium fungivorum TaxID=1890364 RepID=A0A2P6NL25_9EUKA|nr:hypothetical protein PROFUN_07910 [Planoprotostelium fungivorum]